MPAKTINKFKLALGGAFLLLMTVQCSTSGDASSVSTPPVAKVVPHELENLGDVRTDNYYWLRDRENPEVIEYLKAENEYTASVMADAKPLEDKLFEEMKGRIKEDDESVPYRENGYFYYTRFEEGSEYAIYCRKKGSLDAKEEVMLDGNVLAKGHEYFAVRGQEISSGNDIVAYAVDTTGRRIYTVHFRNLTTGEDYADVLPEVTGNMAWANDNKTLFYTKQDLETLRWDKVYRHTLGGDPSKDVLVFEEKDDIFNCGVGKTKSRKYIIIESSQTLSSEQRFLDADNPTGKFKVFLPRERDHEYSIEDFGNNFYIRTNYKAKNFRLMKTPINKTSKEHWTDVIGHRDDVLFEGFDIFKKYLVIEERKEGLVQLRVRDWKSGEEKYIDFGEPAYFAYTTDNREFNTNELRYGYMSMTTPRTIIDFNMDNGKKTILKEDEVLGGFDKNNYVTERQFATARDGAKVPISIVYRKGLKKDGTNPLLLYAYGSYGYSMDAYFSSTRLSLLDRGFVFAIAHIRGGQEMGRYWYEDGKLLNKKNTFKDFIDCAEYMIAEKYTEKDKLFAMGGSAGGLLMGAIINMRPDLFKGVVAAVPFVDVITTMLDPDIPLTTGEYDEWGNPNVKEYYDYILSYSPYDNVEAKAYPNLLVTTGLHDSQVQYWEPAKWVAKLRTLSTSNNRLLLKTNMGAGHGGASGRFKRLHETAFEYAFILDVLGYREAS